MKGAGGSFTRASRPVLGEIGHDPDYKEIQYSQ